MNSPTVAPRDRDEFLAHPMFAQARRLHVERLRDSSVSRAFPGGLRSDVRRVMLFGLILAAEAATDEHDPATWLTQAQVKEAMRSFGMQGPRRIDDIVARLIQTDYLRLDPHAGDRRMRHLRPTDRLAEWYFIWSRAYFGPLHLLFPEPGFGRMLHYDRAFQNEFFRCVARNLGLSRQVLDHDPKFFAFIHHDMAKLLLSALHERTRQQAWTPVREVDLLSATRDLGVSRSHFRNIVALAVDKGYAARHGSRGQYLAATPEWVAASDRFLADSLAATEANYRAALTAIGSGG